MTEQDILTRRAILAGIGMVAGLAFWLLTELFGAQDINARALLSATALTGGFFGTLLVMVGPVPLRRAALLALVVTLPASALFLWASFRFETVETFLDTPLHILAFLILLTLPLPFLAAREAQGPDGWRNYPALFHGAWNMVTRFIAAWAFVGLAWLVLLLCNQFLKLVGVGVIGWLIDFDFVALGLSGLLLGLATAVVNELSDYISPDLVLKLLRLFLPLILVVVAVFILALPFRGLSGLFGNFSAAATLIAMTLGAASLVTVALDVEDARAVKSRLMVASARILTLLMPVMAALAGYAVWLRVAEYGWTPDRLGAALLAALVMGYAGLYAVSVLRGAGWQQKVRQANIIKALIIIGAAALWLSPVLNAERITVNSQIARFEAGQTDIADLDLWSLAHVWGKAGTAGLERLESLASEDQKTTLVPLIAKAKAARNRHEMRKARTKITDLPQLADVLPEAPGTRAVLAKHLATLDGYQLRHIREGCSRRTEAGRPGCIALDIDLRPDQDGPETVILYQTSSGRVSSVVLPRVGRGTDLNFTRFGVRNLPGTAIDRIAQGDFKVQPAPLNMLVVEDS